MHQGTIKCFGERGFGYISRKGQPDIWFHCHDSPDLSECEFRAGRAVLFSVYETLGKARAVDVRVA